MKSMSFDKDIKTFVERACREVEKRDPFLLANDVSEWAVAHRLAVYLEKYFPEYDVDCEYNRMADADGRYSTRSPKKVYGTVKSRPDIIVHKRGPATMNNLLVLELKKFGTSTANDEVFLDAMMADPKFGYKHACHIVVEKGGLRTNWRNTARPIL